jgi:hypothetical protein
MFTRIRKWLRIGSLNRSEHMEEGGEQVENYDAAAAVGSVGNASGVGHVPIGGGMPPDYVNSYDEGRPRK